jgi:hypothetical protein
LPPPKIGKLKGLPCPPKWNEYIPKKIDTQKVYTTCVPTHDKSLYKGSRAEARDKRDSKVGGRKKSVQHPVFPSGRPPQY